MPREYVCKFYKLSNIFGFLRATVNSFLTYAYVQLQKVVKENFASAKVSVPRFFFFQASVKPLDRFFHLQVKMLATPAKFHYVFNLRDLSRIWQGMLKATSGIVNQPDLLLLLWKHECCRVIADRFTDEKDKSWFEKVFMQVCNEDLAEFADVLCLEETPYFVDFLRYLYYSCGSIYLF